MADEKVVLLTTSYLPPHARLKELVVCLEKNLSNPMISEVHVFIEEEKEHYAMVLKGKGAPQKLGRLLDHEKLKRVEIGQRTTYRDLIDYANQHLTGRIAMISNADICFDESLKHLHRAPLENTLVCLSRNDRTVANKPKLSSESQDTWIFQPPLRSFSCSWFFGPRGSDNKLAYEAARSGLKLTNPCFAIRSKHIHSSAYRVGPTVETLPGPYLRVWPCGLKEFLEGQNTAESLYKENTGPEGAFPQKRRRKEQRPDIRPKGPW